MSKEEEIKRSGVWYSAGKTVNLQCVELFNLIQCKIIHFQNSRFQRVKARVKKTSKKRDKKA